MIAVVYARVNLVGMIPLAERGDLEKISWAFWDLD